MAEFEYLRAGNSEATEKKALNALFDPASGVLSGLVVTQTSTASGSVLITSGSALVHPSAVSASLLGNDTSKTLDVFTANPVGGLPRNDIVEFDQITATIIVHVGVPNATPTDPTVPATSVALARLRHLASATTIPTAQIDDLIVPTYLRGVVPPDDTGWINDTPSANWTVTSQVQHRRLNGVVWLRGIISRTTGGDGIITLPAGFRPIGQNPVIPVATTSATPMKVTVNASGLVTQSPILTDGLGLLYLSGVSFPADA